MPYAAHVFSDMTIPVHQNIDDNSPIVSGVVIARDWVLTNAHVVHHAENLFVSWRDSSLIEAVEVISSSRLDLAELTGVVE